MSDISFVYFDVGGVVIKDFSDTNKWEEMLADLGVSPADIPKFDEFYDKYQRKVNTTLDVDELLPLMAKELRLVIPPGYSWLADFVARFDKNETIWPVIKAARAKYKIGLLTNMYPRLMEAIKSASLMPSVKWDSVIDSSIEGVQKPDSVIYQVAGHRASVHPEQILFIDNQVKHLEAAKRAGWQTFHYDSADYEKSSHQLASFLSL